MIGAAADLTLETAPRRLTTVVAADICGYSRLAEIDDDAAVRTVTLVRAAFEHVVARRRGRMFHAAGDGFLAEFPSAADGVLAALEFVADIKARDRLSPISPGAKVRAGVHAGDVVEQPNGDLLGHGVNIAARLQGEAEPNGVLVSLAAVNLVRDSVDARFTRRGPLALRNIDEPVVAFDAAESRKKRGGETLKGLLRQVRRLSPAIVALGILSGLILTVTGATLRQTIRQEANLLRASAGPTLTIPDLSIFSPGEKNYLDRHYLSSVLRTLTRSNHDSAIAILTLLEAGDSSTAIATLKLRLAEPNLSSAEIIEINHQIGAIAELAAPVEAVAAYERILARDPRDFFAAARLAHANLAQTKIEAARKRYQQALTIGTHDERLLLQLRNELAFTYFLERNYVRAIAEQRAIIERAEEIGFEEVEVSARSSLGFALSRNGQDDEAREQYLSVLLVQPDTKYIASKARSAWGIAEIARHRGDLTSAERFYKRALEYETRASRAHGRASNLYYLGLNDLAFAATSTDSGVASARAARIDAAEKLFTESLSVATQEDLVLHENMAIVGLAQVAMLRGQKDQACAYIARSELLLERNEIPIDIISTEVRGMIASTSCPFSLAAD